MIINPSAHTMIPRRNSFRNRALGRRRKPLSIPGGKQLWLGISKVLVAASVILFIASLLLNGSDAKISAEIEQMETIYNEVANSNVLLRAQKARLFSPEAVGAIAGNQLAIHIPVSGQYRKF
jgi:hypothetical protein